MFRSKDVVFQEDQIVVDFEKSAKSRVVITPNLFPSLERSQNAKYDEILAYLMISASSSAATRVDDWVSNWGKDQFSNIATASIGMSFLAFAAFAISSLISGYNFCHQSAAAA
ncbi:hypothetical protein HYC85_029442 [Camellia sinensis]|uniref:CASP-like protein n=1 Tax=Camellia sinensis TaxID=4442 RepID=A0A7J7FZA7_CAMSI|nr:hypothetical protein HYC85_029442 [Camellia sinensis]